MLPPRRCARKYQPSLKEIVRGGKQPKRGGEQPNNQNWRWTGQAPKRTSAGEVQRCICNNWKNIAAATNLHGLNVKNWPTFVFAFVHFIHDSTPKQIKRSLAQLFGKKAGGIKITIHDWLIFSLRIIGNLWIAVQPVMVGGPLIPQVSIDDTYWRKMLVNKSMAGN